MSKIYCSSSNEVKHVLPSKLFVCEGDEVVLKVAEGIWPPPEVCWQVLKPKKCWEDLRGENDTCLVFTARLNQNGNKYRAIVRTKCECFVTNSTKLEVGFIEIISSPQDQCVSDGQVAMFMAEADGRPNNLSAQWQVSTNGGQSWNNIPGATSNNLNVTTDIQTNGNLYRVIFRNRCGQVISRSVEIKIPIILLSGDVNIGNDNPGNEQFFINVLGNGSKVLIQSGEDILPTIFINDFYNSLLGVTSTLQQPNPPPITDSLLSGIDLFISVLPNSDYTDDEIEVLQNFLNRCGKLFFMGDNNLSSMDENIRINNALTALSSSLQLGNIFFDSGFHTTTNIIPDPLTNGVNSITYAAPNSVSGGTFLVLTLEGSDAPNTPFITYEFM